MAIQLTTSDMFHEVQLPFNKNKPIRGFISETFRATSMALATTTKVIDIVYLAADTTYDEQKLEWRQAKLDNLLANKKMDIAYQDALNSLSIKA